MDTHGEAAETAERCYSKDISPAETRAPLAVTQEEESTGNSGGKSSHGTVDPARLFCFVVFDPIMSKNRVAEPCQMGVETEWIGIEGTSYKTIKAVDKKPNASIILDGERPEAFPL